MARRSKLPPGLVDAEGGPTSDGAVVEVADDDAAEPEPEPEAKPAPAAAVGDRVRFSEIRGSMLLDVVARVLAADGDNLTLQIPDNYGQPGEVLDAAPFNMAARRGWWKP